ncbi:M24 family metallopeptidase [Dorea sp. OM07-5]|uniref:aminopeptidase P family N-terminal domain-containing protein n=1 Tax=unclassified Dorea TaxID=2627917 RepID=UPI000E40EB3C|nr:MULTISPECIES: aminopeptidase P family N-terminal domain-containing protein [unclassified Dorea]RGF23983.1 M24 family metallopeptidase [Dorea sp. AM10-31]RHQ57726.1 M24 family metallopeptidase [Dorea sp. AF24-7LB]RHU97826.1 M24 family metallopeptidase [Dorea sp. OM07-5]
MKVSERIAKLRALMAEKGIDAYVVPTADFHQSEYVGEHFKARKYITGFSGSYGTAVICQDDAGLWTDGRYFFQATNELEGSGVRLMKMFVGDTPSVTEYLADKIPEGGKVGFDGRVLSMDEGKEYEDALSPKNISIDYEEDLIDQIWEDRPPLSDKPAFFLEEKYSGESSAHKLERVRKVMKDNGATVHIIASLDDTGWLLNVRGDDIDFFPLLLSYSIVRMDGVDLYVDETKLNDRILEEFKKVNVTLHPYNDIYEDIKKLDASETALIDPMKMNYALYKNIPCKIVEAANPTILMKAMKNDVELENIKEAHIKDGIAITKFMYWIKTRYDKEDITELSSADKLTSLRAAQEGYIRDSFEPLCAFADHAAMMHYSPSKETDVVLKEGAMFLNDTGGGYYEGSTDITRTFILGSIDQDMKKYFTAVVRAMMNLSRANFLYGCHGYNLDVLVRQPIWDLNIDFQCGSGHGVGYLGNVHEPPTGFRWYVVPSKNEHHQLEEGMVITDEPGIYEDGKFGIRIENEFIVRKGELNKYGQFMHFETITFAPIDLDGIDPEEMTKSEREWLNNYHKDVYEKIGPHLTDEEREWLKEYTRAI